MEKNMRRRISVGVIGTGRIGSLHSEYLAYRIPDANLVAVCDIVVEKAEKIAGVLQIPLAFKDYRRIMDDETIEAVIISSSTDKHTEIIEAAAKAGKQIFCEKPIDHDLRKIDSALAAVEKAGVKLQIGFNRRFDHNFRRVHEMIASGKIGVPHILRITSRDPEPPPVEYIKVSGGIFLDMTIHDFDMARFIVGSEVEEIHAKGGVMVDPKIGEVGDIDTAVITLSFINGTLGIIDNSRKAVYGYDQRVEAFGSEGMVAVSNDTTDSAVLSNSDGIHTPLPLFFFMERYAESYISELKSFIECIQQDIIPPVTGTDGRVAVAMGYAAKKSYDENRPVKLSEIDN